jgi:hypothetical protein
MSSLENFFRNDQNRLVIWQRPNLPLVGWFLFLMAARNLEASFLKAGFEFLSSAMLFTWSYLEITQGDSYFRRLLGLTVMVILVGSAFK